MFAPCARKCIRLAVAKSCRRTRELLSTGLPVGEGSVLKLVRFGHGQGTSGGGSTGLARESPALSSTVVHGFSTLVALQLGRVLKYARAPRVPPAPLYRSAQLMCRRAERKNEKKEKSSVACREL